MGVRVCRFCLYGKGNTWLSYFFFHLGRQLSLCQGLGVPLWLWAMLRLVWACFWALYPFVTWKYDSFLYAVAWHAACGPVLRIKHVFLVVFFFSPFTVRVFREILQLQCGRLGKFPPCSWLLTCTSVSTCVNTTDLLTGLNCSLYDHKECVIKAFLDKLMCVLCAHIFDTLNWSFFFKPGKFYPDSIFPEHLHFFSCSLGTTIRCT